MSFFSLFSSVEYALAMSHRRRETLCIYISRCIVTYCSISLILGRHRVIRDS